MGRAGKLDFSIDRVKAGDNQWVPLRYTVTKKSGQSHAVSTGVLTASGAVVFWPAAPVFLLRKGQEITINKAVQTSGFATVSITSPSAAADIELDGTFVGNTPTTLQVSAGEHRVAVKRGIKTWQRTLQVNAGSTITLNASLE